MSNTLLANLNSPFDQSYSLNKQKFQRVTLTLVSKMRKRKKVKKRKTRKMMKMKKMKKKGLARPIQKKLGAPIKQSNLMRMTYFL